MAEYISTFTTGFKDVISKDFPKRLSGVKILNLYDGLIHYQFNGNSRELENIIYFNNTFFLLKVLQGKNLTFQFLVNALCKSKKYFLINKGTFRVRFSKENQFTKVDKSLTRKAEEDVLKFSKLQLDRLSPSSEIWYCLRSEDFAFAGQLIFKREFTEKNLHKGQLRPEVSYLISAFANVCPSDTILEPFCGYGSIPLSLAKYFFFEFLYACDIDRKKISFLLEDKKLQKENIKIFCKDSFLLGKNNVEDDVVEKHGEVIEPNSFSLIISDPPWGLYEDVGDISIFYDRMFALFLRLLKKEGRVVILSARKTELENSARKNNFVVKKSIHTLVNGKKAGLYELRPI